MRRTCQKKYKRGVISHTYTCSAHVPIIEGNFCWSYTVACSLSLYIWFTKPKPCHIHDKIWLLCPSAPNFLPQPLEQTLYYTYDTLITTLIHVPLYLKYSCTYTYITKDTKVVVIIIIISIVIILWCERCRKDDKLYFIHTPSVQITNRHVLCHDDSLWCSYWWRWLML